MSVIVLGAELPKGYEDCWYLQCDLWKDCYRNGMRDDCPLRPLPEKHGRLGDLDAIKKKLAEDKREAFTKHDVWLMLSRYGAETIVEAEGE